MNTKYLKILAILFAAVFSFSACSDDDEDEDTATGLTVTGANWKFDSFRYYESYDAVYFTADGTASEGIEVDLSWRSPDAQKGDITPDFVDVYVQGTSGGYHPAEYEVVSGSITLMSNIKNENRVTVKFNKLKLVKSSVDPYNDHADLAEAVTLNGSVAFEYDY